MRNVLVVRLGSAGDVLLAGPAVRAVAERADRLTLLAGSRGRAAAGLLPGIDEILEWATCPWADPEPGPAQQAEVLAAAEAVRRTKPDSAVILTSFRQDPLPTALVLRMAGVPWITAACEDYAGSLLDVRHRLPDHGPPDHGLHRHGPHEVERMLSVAAAAGFPSPADTRLRLRRPLPDVSWLLRRRPRPYVVVHPGAPDPARAPLPDRAAAYVAALAADGWRVVVTGTPAERPLTAQVAGFSGLDLGGRTTLAELAAVIDGATVVVAGNTAPAHLAAATGTPVVSLFAPTVPAERRRPWRVPRVILGEQDAPCAGSGARECPVPGHPCLAAVTPAEVVAAVRGLTARVPAPAAALKLSAREARASRA